MGFCTEDQTQRFLDRVPGFEKEMVESGIILMKCWLGVGPEEQTQRLNAQIDDPRKIWQLTPMDLKSYDRWNDYTKARDEMFAKTDVSWSPWKVTYSNDKKRARLNVISNLLSSIKYKEIEMEKVKLPKRKIDKEDKSKSYLFKFIPEKF